MGALIRFAQDVVGVAAYFVRLWLVGTLGLGLPVCLIAPWVNANDQGRGVGEPLHSLLTLLFGVIGFVWFCRVSAWLFPPAAIDSVAVPPWDRPRP